MEKTSNLDGINQNNNNEISGQNVENDNNIDNYDNIKQNNEILNTEEIKNDGILDYEEENELVKINENIDDNEEEYDDIIIADAKEDFITKIQNFLIRKKTYCIAFGILSAMYLFFLIINGVFTGQNTIFVSDSFSQVGVFFSHIFKFFRGETTLFYTNFYGKGFEIFSTLQYMYFNPFYLIALLGGEGLIYEMFTISVYFMLVFTLFTFLWFSEKYFKNVNKWFRILFSIMYVFSPFLSFNYSFISWMIYPAIILILVDRFLNFIKTKKLVSFIAVFVWYVVSCFSVGISTAIVLFVLFMLYVYIVIDKEERKQHILNLFIVFVSTALISIAILLPSIIDVVASGRTGSVFYNLLVAYKDYKSSKLSLMSSDYLLIIFSIYYFIKCNKKDKLNKYLMIAFVVTYIPIVFDSVMKILCFSTYNGFVGRFYFLNEVAIFIPTLFIFDKKMWKFNECEGEKFAKVLMEFLMTLMIIFIGAILLFNFKDLGQAVKNPLIVNIGVAKINLGILLTGIIFVGLCLVFNWRKAVSDKLVKSAIVLMMAISLCFNFFTFIGDGNHEVNDRSYIANIIQDTGIKGNIKFHNICDSSYKLDKIDDVRQTSIFSSVTPNSIISSYHALGYLTSNASYVDNSGSLLSDALNGVEYYLSEKKMDRPYLQEIKLKDNSKYYLYKNTLATNGTFLIDTDFSFEDAEPTVNFEKLKNYYGVSGTLFEDVEVTLAYFDDDDNEIEVNEENIDKVKKQKVTFKATKSGILYLNTHLVSDEVEEDGLHSHIINKIDDDIFLDMAYLDAGEEYSFYLYKYSSLTNLNELRYRFMDYEVAKQICEKINTANSIYNYNKDGYEVSVTVDKEYNLYIMTPNIDGLGYTINDESVEVSETLGSMVYVKVNAGENKLVAKYKYPHTSTWLIVWAVCILVIALLFVLRKYGLLKIFEKPVYYAMSTVFGIIVVIVYIIGLLLSFVTMFY